jgi:hypothetical protein
MLGELSAEQNRPIYTNEDHIKKVAQMGYFSPDKKPFPKSNKMKNSAIPYSKQEMEMLMKALYKDLHAIRSNAFKKNLS